MPTSMTRLINILHKSPINRANNTPLKIKNKLKEQPPNYWLFLEEKNEQKLQNVLNLPKNDNNNKYLERLYEPKRYV